MPDLIDLAPRSAFGSHARLAVNGVTIAARQSLGIAAVTVGRDGAEPFSQRISETHALVPPRGPRREARDGVAFIGVAPEVWLAFADGRGSDWAAELGRDLDGLAAVADQSGAYGVLRLEGLEVRDLLARGVSLDLDPAVFPVSRAAVTNLGHFGCILWRLEGPHTFEIAVFRSVAEDVWRSLERTAALLSPEGTSPMSAAAPILR